MLQYDVKSFTIFISMINHDVAMETLNTAYTLDTLAGFCLIMVGLWTKIILLLLCLIHVSVTFFTF